MHTCCCIFIFVMNGFDSKSKWIQNLIENEFGKLLEKGKEFFFFSPSFSLLSAHGLFSLCANRQPSRPSTARLCLALSRCQPGPLVSSSPHLLPRVPQPPARSWSNRRPAPALRASWARRPLLGLDLKEPSPSACPSVTPNFKDKMECKILCAPRDQSHT